ERLERQGDLRTAPGDLGGLARQVMRERDIHLARRDALDRADKRQKELQDSRKKGLLNASDAKELHRLQADQARRDRERARMDARERKLLEHLDSLLDKAIARRARSQPPARKSGEPEPTLVTFNAAQATPPDESSLA